jgi:hypothetical protein
MTWISLMASALAIAASAPPLQAGPNSECPPPAGAVSVALPSGVPPALRDVMGNIALPGEPFDTTDVYVKGHKYRRYMFAWNFGTRWIVAIEQGGFALRSIIFVYRISKDGKTVTLVEERNGFMNNVCGSATKLAGQMKPDPPAPDKR